MQWRLIKSIGKSIGVKYRQYFLRKYRYWYRQYFERKVLVSLLAIAYFSQVSLTSLDLRGHFCLLREWWREEGEKERGGERKYRVPLSTYEYNITASTLSCTRTTAWHDS